MAEDTKLDVLAFSAHPDDIELAAAGTAPGLHATFEDAALHQVLDRGGHPGRGHPQPARETCLQVGLDPLDPPCPLRPFLVAELHVASMAGRPKSCRS